MTPESVTVLRHLPAPSLERRWETSFSKCVVCGVTVTRISKAGKLAAWRHLEPSELPA